MHLKKIFLSSVFVSSFMVVANASAEPLKIALVETLSGPQASTGLLYRSSAKYQIDKINAAGGYQGEQIVFTEYDSQGGPVGAADRVKAAIADGATIILQGSSSAIAGQITEDVRKYNLRNPGKEVLYLNMGGDAMELTGQKCHFYHIRFSPNADIRINALISGMKDNGVLGERVYSFNQNYSWGLDIQNAIEAQAGKYGYKVVGKTLHEVNKIQDFSPYIANIKTSNANTVITGNWSNDLLLLMKAANDAGLNVRFGTTFLDQPGNLANAGKTAEGHFLSTAYNPQVGGEASVKFAEDYKAFSGHYPSYVEPTAIYGLMLLQEALKTAPLKDGKPNATNIALTMENTTIETPIGPFSIRKEDHQSRLGMVIQEVSKEAEYKVDGTEYGFKPIKVLTPQEAEMPVQNSCKMKRPD